MKLLLLPVLLATCVRTGLGSQLQACGSALTDILSLVCRNQFHEPTKRSLIPSKNNNRWFLISKIYQIASEQDQDIEICRQQELLNANIRSLNLEIGQSTLRFNKDISRRRKDTDKRKKKNNGVRISYKFSVLYDGVHFGTELALIWSRRLTEDINWNCFRAAAEDIFDIKVSEADLKSIE